MSEEEVKTKDEINNLKKIKIKYLYLNRKKK